MDRYAKLVFDMKSELAAKLMKHKAFETIESLRELRDTYGLYEDHNIYITVGGEKIKCNSEPVTRQSIEVESGTVPADTFIKKIMVETEVVYNTYKLDEEFKFTASETNREMYNCSECGTNAFGVGLRNPRHGGSPDQRICHVCYERLMECGVKDYQYKPRPQFFGSDDIYFGAEIEMEDEEGRSYDDLHSEAYNVTSESEGLVYCKYDVSISGGFETVTHPFTLDYARNSGNINALFDTLADNGMHGGSESNVTSCGVHIHMSRLGVTRATMFKMLTFIGENKDFVYKISRRTSEGTVNSYCSYSSLASPASIARMVNGQGGSHHEAVALTSSTIEFRIFNSTSRYGYFMSYVEFVHCLRKFAEATSETSDLTAEKYTAFAAENGYTYLTAQISERHICA